jgi:hypothetical protein
MSGQNTPISTSLSFSLNTPSVSVKLTINSDQPGIKTLLVDFFTGAKLFAKIQRTGNGITTIIIQGHPKLLPATLDYLTGLLEIKYNAATVRGETIAVAEEDKFNSIIIEDTLPTLKRDPSSGEFLEKELEEISVGGSAATENVKKIVKEAVASVTNIATEFGIAKGWIPAPASKKEHISVKYKGQRYALEVSSIQSLDMLILEVSKKIKIPQPIKLLYTMEDNDPVVVTDVKDLREGFLYYALNVNEELPKKQIAKFTSMEEFFERLESTLKNPIKKERQMKDIRDAFDNQDIEYEQLMETGDLAITDEKLKEIGIAQLGLRTAILAVIKSGH